MNLIFKVLNMFKFPFLTYQSNMSQEIEQALNVALRRLVNEITRNGELVKFQTKLQQRKQYDACEKDYIENQRLRKELGNQYESSDSEEEKENSFNNLSKNELKRLMRRNLIEKKFDEEVLVPIEDNEVHAEPQTQEFNTARILAEEGLSTYDIKEQTELNIIKEAKQIVEEQPQRETNFGLQYLIMELQRIEKVGLSHYLPAGFTSS